MNRKKTTKKKQRQKNHTKSYRFCDLWTFLRIFEVADEKARKFTDTHSYTYCVPRAHSTETRARAWFVVPNISFFLSRSVEMALLEPLQISFERRRKNIYNREKWNETENTEKWKKKKEQITFIIHSDRMQSIITVSQYIWHWTILSVCVRFFFQIF